MVLNDLFFMDQAYKQALKAYNLNEVPIGAVLVDNASGVIVAWGYNKVEKMATQLAHAEIITLGKAAKKLKNWRMDSLTLYVTVQPCMMCLGGLYLSRVSAIVYGVESPKYGMALEKDQLKGIYQNLHTVMYGIHYEPAKKLLQLFFQKKRSKHEAW